MKKTMKKVFKKIRSKELPTSLLIFLAIFVVSIFGLQVSKMYAQSYLSSSLNVVGSASISGPLSVSGGVGVGTGAPYRGLSVDGRGNFSGTVHGATPVTSQRDALATVSYVESKISSIPSCPPEKICPTCPSCNSCCGGSTPPSNPPGGMCLQFFDDNAPCDGPMPWGARVICPDDLYFGGYLANSCDEMRDDYWRFECCPTLPR